MLSFLGMARKFDIPEFYRSGSITALKRERQEHDSRKKDLSPTILDMQHVQFKVARHFGFCFGVENAIEIAYRAIAENPGKRVFLLSEMIHNPQVNADLLARGVRFILAPDGSQLIAFDQLDPQDIVIVPAFGTTVELFRELERLGINPRLYNATCPFVEKVWKRSHQLGEKGYTVVIHGKHYHEETRATFSHARTATPSIVIRDMAEATKLTKYIMHQAPNEDFFLEFNDRYSEGFDPLKDLERIGVVNQTTMLAHETQAIADYLRNVMGEFYPGEELKKHFADTRDTLCYATSENQDAVRALVESGGDLAIVVGGYNSSNTYHLGHLCAERVPTFYIQDANEIQSLQCIRHMELSTRQVIDTVAWLPLSARKPIILITAGASCPDAVVDQVIKRLSSVLENRLCALSC